MAELPFSEKELLQAAVFFLERLEEKEGQAVVPKFPEGLFPKEINSERVKNYLFAVFGIDSLKRLLEEKGGILKDLEERGRAIEEIALKSVVIPPREQRVIYPAEEEKARPRGITDIDQYLRELTEHIKKLQRETVKKEPLTSTQQEVKDTIRAIEKGVQEELNKAAEKDPDFRRKLKEETPEEVAHKAGRGVEDRLATLTETGQAIRWVQETLQGTTGLPRDKAYEIAEKVVSPRIQQTANRLHASYITTRNTLNEAVDKTIRSLLSQAGVPPSEIPLVINIFDEEIDRYLTKAFSQKDFESAQKPVQKIISRALAARLVKPELVTSLSSSLASQTTKDLQKLASVTTSWDALPLQAQTLASYRVLPEKTAGAIINTKRFIVQYVLGGQCPKKEEPKVENLAKKTIERLLERAHRIRRIHTYPKNLPGVIQEAIVECLDKEEHGIRFVQKIEGGAKKITELPSSLQQSIKEILDEPSPLPSKETVRMAKEIISQEILTGVASPKEEPQVGELAKDVAKELEKRLQTATLPAEEPSQFKQAFLNSLLSSLDEEKQSPSFIQKIRKGVKVTKAAEKIPSSLEDLRRDLGLKQIPSWQKREIRNLTEQGILPEKLDKVPDPAWLVPSYPQTPPGIVASHLTSAKERKKLSKRQQFLLQQAAEIAPRHKITQSLLARLFRLLTGEKDPYKTLEAISRLGPIEIDRLFKEEKGEVSLSEFRLGRLPDFVRSRLQKEITKRFYNAFLKKYGWLKLDSQAGELYSRFGTRALKEGFSRLLSPLRTRFVQGVSRFLNTAGRFLGKAGNFLKQALPMLKNLLSPVLKALAGLLSKLVTALVGLAAQAAAWLAGALGALVSAIGAPAIAIIIIIALVILLILAIFILDIQLPSAFVDFSRLGAGEEIESPYIQVEKTATPAEIDNNKLPATVEYVITITAKDKDLTNIRIEDSFSVYKEGTNLSVSPPTPPTPEEIGTIKGGQSYDGYIYSLSFGPEFTDSSIMNTVTVTADIVGGPKDETISVSTGVQIGKPSTECFVFDSSWTKPEEKTLETQAINKLLFSPFYTDKLCSGGQIVLERDYSDPGYGGYAPYNSSRIIIYNRGLINFPNTLYVLTHESGHIFAYRNGSIYLAFINSGVSLPPPYGDDFLCSYPLEKSEAEDFPETIGVYVTYKIRSYRSCGGKIDMPTQYPKHFEFARGNIFDGFEY